MTAIAGLWRLDGRPDAGEACQRMLRPLEMYGRDGVGAWDGGDIALGRRLWRLLPEDDFDDQPLRSRGELVLVADVRLDNRDELGDALGLPGEWLRASSDADVVLAAFERWDVDGFDRLAGDYAIAVWDGARRRLVLARDPTGRRPLCYHRAGALFAFASLPKGLHALAEIPYEADEARIAGWLLKPGDTGTPFKGVETVGAGCLVVVTPRGVETRRHWNPRRDSVRLKTPDDYAEALRERLDQAVASRLRGATRVGAHLSAGYDSAAVAATAARLLAPDGGRVTAFTAAPRDGYAGAAIPHRLLDESPLAAATAAMHPNIGHVLVRAGDRSPLAALDRNFRLHEQPLLNLCNGVWIDAINDAARDRGLTVMLAGTLGNLGLSYAGLELLPELVRSGRWGHWLAEARAMTTRGARWRGVLARSFGPWTPKDGFEMRMALLADAGAVTQKGVLAEWGVDVRDPTADKRLLEFCLGVPTDQFLRGGQPRSLARRVLADRLPAAVLDSPLTGYQGADWHEGLTADRAGLSAELARLEACRSAARVLDLPHLRQLVETWPAAGWERPAVRGAYRLGLLRAVSAGHFLRKVAGSNG